MKITAAKELSIRVLNVLGFRPVESELITQNLIEAELVEKKTHGLIRLPAIKKQIEAGKIVPNQEEIEIISEHPAVVYFDGKHKPGFYVIYKSLEYALEKIKKSGILAVGLKNLAYASGYIGDYARKATEADLIFIGFHNSPGGLIPFGTSQNLWGTDPITFGIPTHQIPVIHDMASSQVTWGNLMVAKSEGKPIQSGVAVDSTGAVTTDPALAMLGGILPIAGHKGSGLALMVELLAGILTHSGAGKSVKGGWGSFYLLIDPRMFRNLAEFKDEVQIVLDELKVAKKAKGVSEVYFPGERSYLKRQKNLATGEITVNAELLAELLTMAEDGK